MEFVEVTVRIPATPYLTAAEVCKLFRVEDRTLRRWVAAGQFPRPGPGRVWSNWAVFAAMLWRECGPPLEAPATAQPAEADGDGEGGEGEGDESALAARRGQTKRAADRA